MGRLSPEVPHPFVSQIRPIESFGGKPTLSPACGACGRREDHAIHSGGGSVKRHGGYGE